MAVPGHSNARRKESALLFSVSVGVGNSCARGRAHSECILKKCPNLSRLGLEAGYKRVVADLSLILQVFLAILAGSVKPARQNFEGFLTQIRFVMLIMALGAGMLLATRAQATVTNLVWYRLGENDPDASPGTIATNTIDFVDAHNLIFSGPAYYSPDVSTSAVAHAGSSLSVNLQTGAFATNIIVSTLVTNFGMEAWVKPSSAAGSQVIMYNGSTATSGWGIIIGVSNYMGLFGGRIGFGTAPVVPNVWTHVALVRDGVVSTLYINGMPMTTSPATPNIPAGNFALGAPPQAPMSQFFTGLIDEARVFTFAPGQFSTNDLLINRSLVVTTLADGGAGSLRSALTGAFDGDTITFATNGTITLTNGELVLSNSINIAGPGPTNLIINGNNSSRVFYVGDDVTSSISGITVTGGAATSNLNGAGGGIYNLGILTLNNCLVSSNSAGPGLPGNPGGGIPLTPGSPGGAGGTGGGIFNLGILNLSACSIVGNIGGPGGAGGSSSGFTAIATPGGTAEMAADFATREPQLYRPAHSMEIPADLEGPVAPLLYLLAALRQSSRVQRPGDREDLGVRFIIQVI